MKALVICHKTTSDLGIFENILKGRKFEINYYLGHQDVLGDIDPLEHDLLIYMGGPMEVYQAECFPYLKSEISFLKKCLEAQKPYLGICLGSQLLAAALGAEVYVGKKGPEAGWLPIQVNKEGMKTPVRYLDAQHTLMMHWHSDTFDLPKGATLLASSDLYPNQVFSYGSNALGLQCHPEVAMHNIEFILALGHRDVVENKMSISGLREKSQKEIKTLNKQTTLFFNEWLDEVLGKENA